MRLDEPTESLRPSQLKPTLDSHLLAYMAAASAAGVATLALAQAASAEVVYTPANINVGTSYSLDLNHDGVPDFTLETVPYDSGHGDLLLLALDVPGNAVRPPFDEGGTRNAGALPIGARIGPAQTFTTATTYGGAFMGNAFQYGSIHDTNGPWANATNKFLGLKFLIAGEVHYGWARLTVTGGIGAVLTGYAYETVPNQKILAGQRTESDAKGANALPQERSGLSELPSNKEAGLGSLALGNIALDASHL